MGPSKDDTWRFIFYAKRKRKTEKELHTFKAKLIVSYYKDLMRGTSVGGDGVW